MSPKENPPHKGKGAWNDLPVTFHNLPTASTMQTQTLIARYGVRPVMAAILAAVVFGEGRNHV